MGTLTYSFCKCSLNHITMNFTNAAVYLVDRLEMKRKTDDGTNQQIVDSQETRRRTKQKPKLPSTHDQ